MYTIYADDALLYSPGDEELSVLSRAGNAVQRRRNAHARAAAGAPDVQRAAQNADAD